VGRLFFFSEKKNDLQKTSDRKSGSDVREFYHEAFVGGLRGVLSGKKSRYDSKNSHGPEHHDHGTRIPDFRNSGGRGCRNFAEVASDLQRHVEHGRREAAQPPGGSTNEDSRFVEARS
jgi:hypothetical protein